jgi:hypothetical protein
LVGYAVVDDFGLVGYGVVTGNCQNNNRTSCCVQHRSNTIHGTTENKKNKKNKNNNRTTDRQIGRTATNRPKYPPTHTQKQSGWPRGGGLTRRLRQILPFFGGGTGTHTTIDQQLGCGFLR